MEKDRTQNKKMQNEVRRLKEKAFSFEQVNDYPLSDKTLVVSPQVIPLSTEELSVDEITEI